MEGYNCSSAAYFFKTGALYGSNDNNNWTKIKDISNTNFTYAAKWFIDLSNNTNYYYYYKLVCTEINNSFDGWFIGELGLIGKELSNQHQLDNLYFSDAQQKYCVKY